MVERLKDVWADVENVIWWRLARIRCWFIGHDRRMGEQTNYEADYCARCGIEWPQDLMTLPDYIEKADDWFAERDW